MKALSLPYAPDAYFTSPPGSFDVATHLLTLSRSRPDGVEQARKRMRKAYEGKGPRRIPVDLREDPESGTYVVVDGNSTVTVARENDWPTVRARFARTTDR